MKFKLLLLLLFPLLTFANIGDTTYIRFHNKMDMTYYGNFDFKGKFPDGSKTYHQIIMKYTLGCASTGCSGWDYTNHIQYLKPLGIFDSSISKIDTSGGKHDTTWKKTERIDKYELGRVITPYGTYMQGGGSNGYLPTWQHRYWFDVTDLASILKDSGTVRCLYSGYISGFSATVEFYFIEGTPPRNVLKFENVWGSGGANCMGYSNSSQFETTQVPAKALQILPNTKSASFQFTSSGHGGDNNINAAEFNEESADVIWNKTKIGRMHLWRDDCGKNPIYPQGGTWIYNRANWCPGTKVNTFYFEIDSTKLHPGNIDSVDVNYDPFTWTGNQTPCYAIGSLFVQYGDYNYKNDLSLTDIIAPSTNENYRRLNPVCYNPVIEVKNKGKNSITSCTIIYGLRNGIKSTYNWTGNLAFNQTQQITLPSMNWTGAVAGSVFDVEITSVNNKTDEWIHDNKMSSNITITPKHETTLVVWFKTNNFPLENKYKMLDWSGNVIYEKNNMTTANTVYKDTISMAVGCYTFIVEDEGGDGMNWWANKDVAGIGTVYFKNMNGNLVKNFQMDFGSEIRYQFTTAYLLGVKNEIDETESIIIYPNPSTGTINIAIANASKPSVISIYDMNGKLIFEKNTEIFQSEVIANIGTKGIYLVKVNSGDKILTQRVIIQ